MNKPDFRNPNIVDLSRYRDEHGIPELQQLETYWQSLRFGRLVPMRSEFDPRSIEQALPHIFLLERIAPGLARFRLAGMRVVDLMGLDLRGMPLSGLFQPAARPQLSEAVDRLFNAPASVRLQLEAAVGFGRPALSAQMLILPMRSDKGDISRAIGCVVSDGTIGRTPRRFGIGSLSMRTLKKQPSESPGPAHLTDLPPPLRLICLGDESSRGPDLRLVPPAD